MLDLADALDVKITSQPWDGMAGMPYYLYDAYDFRKVAMDEMICIFAQPKGKTPTIQAIVKHFEDIHSIAAMPVVLKLDGLSGERRKVLIKARVPFVANEQIYLPFMGAILQERQYREPTPREKMTPSTQLLFFAYLYQESDKIYTGPMAKKLGISAMQVTRAVRQLQCLNLFDVSKDGVSIVANGRLSHRDLFEAAEPYLLDPVREILYVARSAQLESLPYSGISALSEISMLGAADVPTFAYYGKKDAISGENALTDRERQVRIEVWKYAPTMLSMNRNLADPLSIIVSLRDERDDPRIEQAIEGIYRKIWR